MLVSPFAKLVRSFWAFHWRLALMRRYLELWDASSTVEGASQRIHEDTQRFASALQGCLAVVLDAVLTLAVFAPLLVDLGARAVAPWHDEVRVLGDGWLVVTAVVAATLGLGGAMVFGKHLVLLEFANQRVEAALRRLLVLREVEGQPRYRGVTGLMSFDGDVGRALADLRRNYHRLFRHFWLLNTWLSGFDQACVLLPYFLVAPLVFAADPERRITLGVLVQVANCFDKVFGSLSVVADSWGAVNDFRSTLLRLREFEANLLRGAPPVPPRGGAPAACARRPAAAGRGPRARCRGSRSAPGSRRPTSPSVGVEVVEVVHISVVDGEPTEAWLRARARCRQGRRALVRRHLKGRLAPSPFPLPSARADRRGWGDTCTRRVIIEVVVVVVARLLLLFLLTGRRPVPVRALPAARGRRRVARHSAAARPRSGADNLGAAARGERPARRAPARAHPARPGACRAPSALTCPRRAHRPTSPARPPPRAAPATPQAERHGPTTCSPSRGGGRGRLRLCCQILCTAASAVRLLRRGGRSAPPRPHVPPARARGRSPVSACPALSLPSASAATRRCSVGSNAAPRARATARRPPPLLALAHPPRRAPHALLRERVLAPRGPAPQNSASGEPAAQQRTVLGEARFCCAPCRRARRRARRADAPRRPPQSTSA